VNRWWVGTLLHLAGFAVVAGILAIGAAIPALNDEAGGALSALAIGAGIIQLVWVIPLVLVGVVKGWSKLVWGVAVPAALVLLLNTACWGFVIVAFSNV
jgi:hypothetical protein